MSDVMRMQLDIQSNLEKEVQKSSKAMKGFNSLVESASSKFENIANTVGSKLVGAFKKVEGAIGKILPGFVGLFSAATIFDAVRGVLEMDTAMTQLAFRMGHGAEGARELKGAVFETSGALGISNEKAGELVTTLTEMRVPLDMMGQMSKATGAFAELTGMARERAAELGGSLITAGGMGADAASSMMNGMVQVQRAVGFTTNEMNTLGDSIMNSTQMLNTMGKTGEEIQEFNSGVVELAGAFASVGLEANKATELIDELLDPSKVEDNAFLLSQLGVSMSDAFAGDLNPGELARGFRDMGQQLQNMTGPAAAAMAEQLGMGVREARQLGEMSDEQLNKVAEAMANGEDAAAAMQSQLNDERTPLQNFNAAIEEFKNTIGEVINNFMPDIDAGFKAIGNWIKGAINWFRELPATIKKLVPLALLGLTVLFKVMKTKFFSVATEAGTALSKGVSEGMKQGAEKGKLAIQEAVEDPRAIDLRVRTQQGPGYQEMMKEAELWEARAATSLVGPVKRLAQGTAEWKKQLANSTKPLSKIEASIQRAGQNARARYETTVNERTAVLGAIDARKQEVSQEIQSLRARRQILTAKREAGEIDSREAKELDGIIKRVGKLSAARSKLANERDARSRRYAELERANFRSMTQQQIIEYGKAAQAKVNQVQSNIAAIQQEAEKNTAMYNRTKAATDELLNKERQGIQLTAQETAQLNTLLATQEKQKANMDATNAKLSQANTELDEATQEVTRFNQQTQGMNIDLTAPGEERRFLGLASRIGDRLKLAAGGFKTGLASAGHTLMNSITTAGQAMKEKLNPKNWGAGIRGAVRGMRERRQERRQSGGRRGIMGGGLVGLIAGFLMRFEPVQNMIKNIMESIKPLIENLMNSIKPFVDQITAILIPVITRIVDALIPIVESLMNSLMPVIQSLIDFLMPVIMRLVNILAPIFEMLMKAIGPLLESLFNALMPLIDILLPPLLWVLGAMLEISGKMIETIGNLLKFLVTLPTRIEAAVRPGKTFEELMEQRNIADGAMYRAADAISNVGATMATAGREMRETAFDRPENTQAITAAVAEGTAEGTATAEARTTWEPAQIRALREGIRVEQELTSVTTGGGSAETQTASNAAVTAEASQATAEASERELTLLEQQELRSQRRHEEMMEMLLGLNRTMSGGGPRPNPISGGL